MENFLVIIVVALIFCSCLQLSSGQGDDYQCNPVSNGLSDNCIGCICEASTRCDVNTKCVSGGTLCGPFYISKGFWVDGGRCVIKGDNPNDGQSWKRCAKDLVCAANTIRSYINRFGKDCNGDSLVTCDDYTMIHKNGGWNCGNNLQGTDFWNIYLQCKNVIVGRGEII